MNPLPALSTRVQARMPESSRNWIRTSLSLAVGTLLLSSAAIASVNERNGVVSVYSGASPAYTRTTLPDGKFKPETYAFGEGGDLGGAMKDGSIDKLSFMDIARRIAPSLASQNYVPTRSKDPKKTDILIMLYWGSTSGTNEHGSAGSNPMYQIAQANMLASVTNFPAVTMTLPRMDQATGADGANQRAGALAKFDPRSTSKQTNINDSNIAQADLLVSVANRFRDRQNQDNAAMIGYLPELLRVQDYQLSALRNVRQAVVDDIEENRYFVILVAYDFQKLYKNKERQILWQSRFSIRQNGNDFNKELAAMSQYASKYYGKDSGGLLRQPLADTNVTIGEATFLNYEPEKKQ